ncbi:LysR family transcriptional regulator [Paeniglutamicibacter sp. MACA_103]|uniref:LysR family transcriptional regulator n=1 Tax=Paeniglutamicibacter sp. MACA_103 TaxID=3377337 RepID=UPI003895953C
MDFFRLTAFLAVAGELHFGRAAQQLHVAQPVLSRTIRSLEADLGARLFARNTRNVELTPEGAALVEPARDVLKAVDRAKRSVIAAGRGETGLVRVAFAGASTHAMVGQLAKVVRVTHPAIQFELYSSNYATPAMDKVMSGAMEIGFGRWDVLPAGVATRVVARERLVLALPARHRLAREREISMEQLRDEPFVALPPHPGAVLEDRLRRLCAGAGFAPNIVQVAPDSWTVISLVAAEIGCSLTLSSVAENVINPDVSFVELRDRTEPILLRMAWKARDPSPALTEVLRIAEGVIPTPSVG